MFQKLVEKSVLKKLSAFRELDGWLTDQEALGLYLAARKTGRHATVVEIGSWQGKSTYCLAKGLRSGKVYAIDPFNADAGADEGSRALYLEKKGGSDLLEQFRKSMEKLQVLKDIVIKQGYSHQFHQDFDKIDLLFIDGDHSIKGCVADFELYSPKVVRGGFIAFHDYYEDRDELGPTYVIKNLVSASHHFRFYRQYDSLWIARRII
jgi:predicted O-methyltransferase YrrM